MEQMMSVCRLCLAENAAFDIFSKKDDLQLTYRIVACTSLEINPNDNLPHYICAVCRIQLDELYDFRKKCLAADRRLRQHRKLLSLGQNSDLYANQSTDNEDDENGKDHDQVLFRHKYNRQDAMRWRKAEAEKLNAELQTFKKNLETVCTHELRAGLEVRAKQELKELILNKTKVGCRLQVLDDLFNEIKTFFIQKRDEARDSICISENPKIDDSSTQVQSDTGAAGEMQINDQENDINNRDIVDTTVDSDTAQHVKVEITHKNSPGAAGEMQINDQENDINNRDIVDTTVDSDTAQHVKVEITHKNSPHNLQRCFVNIKRLPMVEINMQNDKYGANGELSAKKQSATTKNDGLGYSPKNVNLFHSLKENKDICTRSRLRRQEPTNSSKSIVPRTSTKQSTTLSAKQFKCLHCKRSFVHKRKLDTHVTKKHMRTWLHRCKLCSKRFHRAESLALHLQTH